MVVDAGAIAHLRALAFSEAATGLALVSVKRPSVGRLIAVNRALEELTGRSEDDLLSRGHVDRLALLGAPPAIAEHNASLLRRLAAGEIAGYREVTGLVHTDGHYMWLEATASLVREDSGEPACALLHVVDVTGRELFEQRLEARRRVARALAQVETAASAISALPATLGPALDAAFAAAWVPDEGEHTLRMEAAWQASADLSGFAGASRSLALARGQGLPGRALAAGEGVAVSALPSDDPRADAACDAGVRGAIAVPVTRGTDLAVLVELEFTRPIPRADVFAPALADIAGAASELVGTAWAEERRRPSPELLLVEDNEFIARLVREMLVNSYDESLELIHVKTLAHARDRLATTRPACVLLDLNLPDTAGLATLTALRVWAPEVPVVVLTGEEDEGLAVHAVKEGAQDYLMKRKVDMHGLARSIRYAIERKGVEQNLLSHRLRHPLTKLPTRVLFLDQLRVALSTHGPGEVAVLVVDLDRFRVINHSLGHEAGDRLLVELARRLTAIGSDAATVASLGGDTFALFFAGQDAEFAAIGAAGRLCSAMAKPVCVDGQDLVLTATVGVALNHSATLSAEDLLADADSAMSRAKEAGGGHWEIFEESVRAGLREELRLEGELRAAIERDELRLHYQPIIALADRRLVAFEALVRWQHPERGMLGAGDFVPLAERAGLIVALGRWVLRHACLQLREWRVRSDRFASVRMHVNLAAAQVRDTAIVADVMAVLAEHRLDPGDLCLEVTETSVMEEFESAVETLQTLRSHGIHVALDDFGTGYSSLSYLSRLPIDSIKLDRSFLVAAREQHEAPIVALVGSMAAALALPAVAEGIEVADDIGRLRAYGYGYGQGYWLGAPEPPEAALGMVTGEGVWIGETN